MGPLIECFADRSDEEVPSAPVEEFHGHGDREMLTEFPGGLGTLGRPTRDQGEQLYRRVCV